MKKIFLVSFLFVTMIFLASNSFAQIRKIPAEVTEALKQKYPDANNVSWKDKLTVFSASFEMNNEKYEARFTDKGEWKNTDRIITDNNLPEKINDGFSKSKYADWEIKSVIHIDLPDNIVQYRIQVAKSNVQKKNLLFSVDGQLLRDNATL